MVTVLHEDITEPDICLTQASPNSWWILTVMNGTPNAFLLFSSPRASPNEGFAASAVHLEREGSYCSYDPFIDPIQVREGRTLDNHLVGTGTSSSRGSTPI